MPPAILPVVPLLDLVSAIDTFRRRSTTPAYSLFLGAGASKSSGIPLAEELAHRVLLLKYTLSEGRPPADEPQPQLIDRLLTWMKRQPWYDADRSLYSVVMEGALPNAGIRQAFLEENFSKAVPSVGYRRLGGLLQERIFDTVFTTNFDRLVAQGAWGQAVRTIMHLADYPHLQPSPAEPRLIRLHGDFWHEDVLNTEGELESASSIRFDAVARLCQNSGLIVTGYGGADRKVMVDLFHKNMANPSFLRNGLYWCIMRGGQVPEMVRTLASIPAPLNRRVSIIEIDGFDEFMDTLARKLGVQDWRGEYEAAHQSQAIYKELLDILFQPDPPDAGDLTVSLRRVLGEMARQVQAREAWFIGVTGSKLTVISSNITSTVMESERLFETLFQNVSMVQQCSGKALASSHLPVSELGEDYQVIAVRQSNMPLGALITPVVPRARDTDHFLISVTARMMSLIYQRFASTSEARRGL